MKQFVVSLLIIANTFSNIIASDSAKHFHSVQKQISPRVFGGRTARPNELPYQAAIYTRVRDTPIFNFVCGGAIYSKMHIVSAGHCLLDANDKKIEPKNLKVIVGQNQVRLLIRELTSSNSALIPVADAFVHEGLKLQSVYFVQNDLGIIRLNQTLKYSNSVKKIRIASANEVSSNGVGDVSGYGRTEAHWPDGRPIFGQQDLPVSLPLKIARLRVIPRQLCTIRHLAIIPNTILCVAGEGVLDTQSACYGDSGGPLVQYSSSGPYLSGLVSTGTGCGLRLTPAFYTDVSKYYSWIRQRAGPQF